MYMWKIFQKITKPFIKVLAFLFYPVYFNLFTQLRNSFYAEVMRKGFKKVGKDFYLEYPSQILGAKYIEIGESFSSFARLRLEAFDNHNGHPFSPAVFIGEHVSMNYDCHIGACNKIVIGNNVLIGSNVLITDHFHGEISAKDFLLPPGKRKLFSKGPVIIGNNVWIGDGVAIMPNITIGDNSVVGANAVVTSSFPANAIIAGNPAKLIRIINE